MILSCVLKVTGCDWFQGVTKDKSDGDYKEWTVRDEDGDKDAARSVFLEIKKGGSLFLHTKSQDLVHQMCCSVHDFPHRPSWEARSQQDHFGIECLIPQTAESSSGIASVHRGDFSPSIFFL